MIHKTIDYHTTVKEAIKEYEEQYGEEPTALIIHPAVYSVFKNKRYGNLDTILDLQILTSPDVTINSIRVV